MNSIVNKKVYHEYFVLETLEVGIELRGNEIKSIRNGMCNINQAWVDIKNNELFIKNMHITKWSTSNLFDVDEKRDKKLLAHKNEIRKLLFTSSEKGIAIVPIKVYFSNHRCKLEIGVCKGKKLYDKRNDLKEKQIKRDIERGYKE